MSIAESPVRERAEITVSLDQGSFRDAGDPKVWKAAQGILCQLLTAVVPAGGEYIARIVKKTRWQGNHDVPFKLGPAQLGWIYLTIKVPDTGNGEVYDYAIRAKAGTPWLPDQMQNRIREHIERLAAEAAARPRAIPTPTPAAPVPVVSAADRVSDRVARLEQLATRNDERIRALTALSQEKVQYREQLAEMQRRVADVEARELALMEEMDSDKECVEAQESLAALRRLLGA
jgi:hypothetical protein